jgi:acetamidase/formamidase
MLERLPIQDGTVIVSERVRLPLRPMIGCLGLAPAEGETSTLSPAMPWAGNYDLTQIAPGATMLFPAQVPGGIFSLGDLHAAMGEHEATFIAIECAGSATVRLDVRPGLNLESPRIETADRIFVMGLSAWGDYGAARLQAARLLYELLTRELELTPWEAYARRAGVTGASRSRAVGLSSAATRFWRSIPQPLQRWTTNCSPSVRKATPTAAISARQGLDRSPGRRRST